MEGPALVEGEAVLLKDPVRTNLFEERLKKPDVPLALRPAAVDAVVHQILKRMTADRHFYSTSKRCNALPLKCVTRNNGINKNELFLLLLQLTIVTQATKAKWTKLLLSKQAGLVRI